MYISRINVGKRDFWAAGGSVNTASAVKRSAFRNLKHREELGHRDRIGFDEEKVRPRAREQFLYAFKFLDRMVDLVTMLLKIGSNSLEAGKPAQRNS